MFSLLKDFVEENSVETSNTGNDQCQAPGQSAVQFCKYFPGAVSDKYEWIMGPFHVDLPPNYNFSLEKEKKLY
jgi:hypothetical protein